MYWTICAVRRRKCTKPTTGEAAKVAFKSSIAVGSLPMVWYFCFFNNDLRCFLAFGGKVNMFDLQFKCFFHTSTWHGRLTYGQPLHQLREFGIPVKEFDLIDEAKLTADQIWKFCAMM